MTATRRRAPIVEQASGAGRSMPRWIVVCGRASVLAALPTAVWRVLPGLGVSMGTSQEWRDLQYLPGAGTPYVLGLSVIQVTAAACCLLLTVDVRRVTPAWAPDRLRRAAPRVGGVLGLVGAAVLALIVVASILAWDRVDPFAGQSYDGWAWLCATCYLAAVPWPVLLAAASVGYLRRGGRA